MRRKQMMTWCRRLVLLGIAIITVSSLFYHPSRAVRKFLVRTEDISIPADTTTSSETGVGRRFLERNENFSLPSDITLLIANCTPSSETLEYPTPESFEGFDNETGVDHFIVPNIIHFIRFNFKTMPFYEYLCILAAYRAQNPCRIFIHTNVMDIEGYYWDKLKEKLGDVLQVRYKELAEDINGLRGDFHVFHFSDVARIQVLMTYGGIYLDADSFLLKSVDPFRKFEMALGWPEDAYLGTQVIVAHKNSRFLRKWLESYKQYDPSLWYYNAGQLPTTSILIPHPELVHRVTEHFGVRDISNELYNMDWDGWKDRYYAIHLLIRHRFYLAPQDIEETGIYENFTEESVKGYDRTFGQLARLVLYNTTEMLAESIRKKS